MIFLLERKKEKEATSAFHFSKAFIFHSFPEGSISVLFFHCFDLHRPHTDMGLFIHSVDRESLKPGDHIYTWRAAYVYAHHGIYIGDGDVIHFTNGPSQEVGTGTVLDRFLTCSSSVPTYRMLCSTCTQQEEVHGVISSCLDCFLAGGVLCRYEYAVNLAFLVSRRGGTCTLAAADPAEKVIHRATYLFEKNGFGPYEVLKNNCEDFAIYCKTSLHVDKKEPIGQSGQVGSIVNGLQAAFRSKFLMNFVTTNVYVIIPGTIGVYVYNRYHDDISMRKNVVSVEVEDLTRN